MSKKRLLIGLTLLCTCLVGCAKPDLKTPCPNYGTQCAQAPINSWDY